ncbi:tubulin epsilon and delta complex protein 1 isoform X2 [Rissa tridactyla]|uniref:tubulin epsilon and delta complex protein 1 isoform X2 n=1 Tax=Rissa tridactyla TaxID=75485 RepID=UPI0023BA73F3|nr:tubulin epsilon and delta complex protein 1 isoform X2 [Rissa tridactyla]
MRRRQQEQEQQGQQPGRGLPAAVGALCRALPPRARPAPDTLRRARFDRPQASLDFWRLLYTLLKQIHGGKWTESDAIDNQIRFVKSALWYHGYGRPELYRLPSDGSAGSRELLLAFSWLLHRVSLLEQLLARNRVKTGDETSVCTIHLFTSGSHMDQILGHFSATETDLVRQPENYKQLLQLLDSETMQLEAYLEWKQLEPVYWQWMETVLDNMAEEGKMCESQDAHVEKSGLSKATSCCPWADGLTGQIDRLSRDLMTLHDQLHKLVTHRKAAWCEKVKTREEELEKEGFSAAARKIQESVELKLLDLISLCAPEKKKMHGSCRLVFRSKHPASKTGFDGCVSKEPVSAVSAAEVIRDLQLREASLGRELKQLQEECRRRLDEIAEGLDRVICIPP